MSLKPEDSHIALRTDGGATLTGELAMKYFKGITLVGSLKLFAKTGIIPTRGVTSTVMLKLATEFTGKKYKRGQHLLAAEDVQKWCDEVRPTIPTSVDGKDVQETVGEEV